MMLSWKMLRRLSPSTLQRKSGRREKAGLKIAKATYERHQTFRTLLEDLGVDGKTAAADACLMEHAVSPESYEAIKGLTKRKKADGDE